MKKILLIICAIISMVAAQAQDLSVKKMVEWINAECPMDLEEGMTLQKVTDNINEVVFQIKMNDDVLVSQMGIYKDEMQSSIEEIVKGATEDNIFNLMIKALVTEKKNFVFKIDGTSPLYTVSFNIPHTKLARYVR